VKRAGVLLVGLGAIGLRYDLGRDPERFAQTHARAFSRHPAFRLAAAVDPEPARRREFTDAYSAPAFETIDAALAGESPEVVVIATPTDGHSAALEAVLARCQPKLVLCEKPLAETPAVARAMLAACERAGVQLYVNYFRRALPAVVEIRDRFMDGRIPADAKAVGWYTKGLMHNGSHFLDLMSFWLGAVQHARPLGAPRAGMAGADLDCQLRFERGEALLLAAWEEAYAHSSLELLARNGRLTLERSGVMRWQAVVPDPAWPGYHCLSGEATRMDMDLERYQWHVADRLARRLAGQDEDVLCDGAQALAAVETIDALLGAAGG
jgi:predicted dehydrogenase